MSTNPPSSSGGPTSSWILNVIIGGGLGGLGFAIAMWAVEKVRGGKAPPERPV